MVLDVGTTSMLVVLMVVTSTAKNVCVQGDVKTLEITMIIMIS